MTATILIIEYIPNDMQKALTAPDREAQAEKISALPGLHWKVWLEEQQSDRRGGVYLFASKAEAEQGASMLTDSLRQAGASDVTAKQYNVDSTLSAITNAPL